MARCEFYRRRSTGAEARRRFIAARRHIGGEARGVHGPGLGTRVAVSGRFSYMIGQQSTIDAFDF